MTEVFLANQSNRALQRFFESGGSTILIPVGSTEQHGPHGPLGTDHIIAQEVCRRVAQRIGALVAPTVPYGLSYPHRGFLGEISLSIDTFMSVVSDLVRSFARAGFRRIVFLNGHYDNTYAIAYGCAKAASDIDPEIRAFPVAYWDGLTEARADEYLSLDTGLHANIGETSVVLAIDPRLIDMTAANREFPAFPEFRTRSSPVHLAFFLTAPGTVHRASHSGTWGDARRSSAELGEQFLGWIEQAVVDLLVDIENTYKALPIRPELRASSRQA